MNQLKPKKDFNLSALLLLAKVLTYAFSADEVFWTDSGMGCS